MTASEAGGRNGLEGRARFALLAAIAALMVVPLVILRLVEGYEWDPGDAVFLFILLAMIAAAFELAAWVSDRMAFRVGLGLAMVTGLLQIWVNLAVGIIGSEDNPANLIYAAVIAVAVIGSVIAGFRERGMALAMAATAAAQAATFFVALAAGFGFTGPITVFFVSLWLTCSWLFRRAARARLA